MVLIPQPLPWVPLSNREIADGHNNVVQYTHQNIGLICLAVNFHQRIMNAIALAEKYITDPDVLQVLRSATGRIGAESVIKLLEAAAEPSNELDMAIAAELQIPISLYTSSTDMSMTLIPQPWTCAFNMTPEGMSVLLSNGDLKAAGSHKSLSMAISIASMKARAMEPSSPVSIAEPEPVKFMHPAGDVVISYAPGV